MIIFLYNLYIFVLDISWFKDGPKNVVSKYKNT